MKFTKLTNVIRSLLNSIRVKGSNQRVIQNENPIFSTPQRTVYMSFPEKQEEVNKEKKDVNKQENLENQEKNVNNQEEVNKEEENLENQEDVNKQEKSLKFFPFIKTHAWEGLKILLFYPVLTLGFFFIIFDFPEVLLFLTILWKKIMSIFMSFFAAEPALEITAAPTIQFLSLNDYWSEEYIIYKKIFLNQVSNNDASSQMQGLKKALHPTDLVSLENRLQEEVLNKYIQIFLVEKYGEYSTFNLYEKIVYFLRCEESHLRLLFTKESLIPSLTLSEFQNLEYNGYPDVGSLKKRLSLDDLKTLESDSPVGIYLSDVDSQPKPKPPTPKPVVQPQSEVVEPEEVPSVRQEVEQVVVEQVVVEQVVVEQPLAEVQQEVVQPEEVPSVRQEVEPPLAQNVPTAKQDVPVDPHVAGKRNTPSVKPEVVQPPLAEVEQPKAEVEQPKAEVEQPKEEPRVLTPEAEASVNTKMALVEDYLADLDQNYLNHQKSLCDSTNNMRYAFAEKKQDHLSRYPNATNVDTITKMVNKSYTSKTKEFENLTSEAEKEYLDDYATIKQDCTIAFKNQNIDITNHPVMARQPLDASVTIPPDVDQAPYMGKPLEATGQKASGQKASVPAEATGKKASVPAEATGHKGSGHKGSGHKGSGHKGGGKKHK